MSQRHWPQPQRMSTAEGATRASVPRRMLEPYDYPQPRRTGEAETLEVARTQGSVEDYRRRVEDHQRKYGRQAPAHPDVVIPPVDPRRPRMESNPGITVAPGIDINRIPRPSTMMPPPPSDHPATHIQRQMNRHDPSRIYGASSPSPQAPYTYRSSESRTSYQPRRGEPQDEYRPVRVASPQIYANWPQPAPPIGSSSKPRASSQPPHRKNTRQPSNPVEAAQLGMVKRHLTPVPAIFAPDPESTVKLDVGGHGAVCVKDFLTDPAYRAQLKNANKQLHISDEHTYWMVAWPGYNEELYSLNVGKYPTYDKVVEALCRAFTRFVEIDEEEHRDMRQADNLKWWKLGRGGLTTDRVWIGSLGENKKLKRWVSYFYVNLPDDPRQLRADASQR